ncbi:unnamed protein product [Blepharisma stoltei]|uniref:Guanylate cyclase domain-containing protein n=1 Tax=Blepharisma stoltei TaxID=1481888 RepID=A0AAU9JMM9_9CILI|nr:unnamed protein product [Blepharisma stoltei]
MSLNSNLNQENKNIENWRNIHLLGSSKSPNKGYPKNLVMTSRYTLWNFFPKNISEQFQNYAYYLYLIDPISELIKNPYSWDWTSAFPIVFLIILTCIFDACRDVKNHKNDKSVNDKLFEIWDGFQFVPTKSKNICVGDIILLNENDYAPADVLIICIGEEEKVCYIDRAGIIGGTDIKVKKPIKDTQRLFDTDDIEEASAILNRINAKIKIPDSSSNDICGTFKMSINPSQTEINPDNFIQQWSHIIETSWILGVVIYTGYETSVSISIKNRANISNTEKQLNIWVLWIGSFYFCMVLISFLVNFLAYGTKYGDNALSLFMTIAFNLNKHVPIFLFLILPIIRLVQIWRISKYYKGVTFHSSKVNEDLGQVEYILTDRSGTITKNKLIISSCMVNGIAYANIEEQYDNSPELKTENSPFRTVDPNEAQVNNWISSESQSFDALKHELIHSCNRGNVYNFILCMAICNQFFPKMSGKCISISADDRTFVETAGQLGIQLVNRTNKSCIVNILGDIFEFSVIAYRPFSSKSKKNRIIVYDNSSNQTILFVKGAKDSMNELFDLTNEERLNFEENLYSCNLLGKRLIFMGYKVLSDKDYKHFHFGYKNAKRSPVNSEGRIESIFEALEQKLKFLGCVAIEDKVSKRTREAVTLLSQAGIKFWLMSGEDEEITLTTAISANMFDLHTSIARLKSYSSQLECTMDMIKIVKRHIIHSGEENLDTNLLQTSREYNNRPSNTSQNCLNFPKISEVDHNWTPKLSEIIERKNSLKEKSTNIHPFLAKITTINMSAPLSSKFNADTVYFVLSIDARGISYELSCEENRKLFCAMLSAAHCVCFHSLLPRDKRQIASLLRNNFSYNPTFLAIGDGAGDVGMIKQAHVGVGIIGKRGNFAADAGHIAVRDFSQIKNLILFEGHWNYVNVSNIILIYLFGSFMHTWIIFCYTCVKNTGGISIFSIGMSWYYYGFLTAIPLIIIGIFDEDVKGRQIAKFPEMHNVGLYKLMFISKRLWIVAMKALAQGILIFFFVFYCGILNDNGYTENSAYMSIVMYISLYSSFLIYLILETYSYNVYTISSYVFSLISLIVFLEIMSEAPNSHMNGDLEMTYISPLMYCHMIFLPLICLIINYAIKCCEVLFYPSFIDFIRNKFAGKLYYEAKSRIATFNEKLDKIYKDSKAFRKSKESTEFTINKWTWKFLSPSTEIDYQNEKINEYLGPYRAFAIYRCAIILCIFIYVWNVDISEKAIPPFYTACSAVYGIFAILSFIPYFKYKRNMVTMLMNIYDIIMIIVHSFIFDFQIPAIYLSWPPLILIGSCMDWIYGVLFSLIISSCVCVSAYLNSSYLSTIECYISGTEFTVIYFAIWISSAIIGYSIEKYDREKFILLKKVENEVEKSKQVLDCVLPEFVRKRVKDGARYIADDQGIATVLFCDIHNFEDIVEAYPLHELIAFLDNVYRQFDNLCELVGVTKIETVGKTYMACAGIKDSEAELDGVFQSVPHGRRAIEMGMAVLKTAEKIKLKNGGNLQVKIGIHSGPVTAGVVGYHKPQFSLVGDTVNTASRMSSTNQEPNTIQISEETYNNNIGDKDDFIFTELQVEAKGKGSIKAFKVEEKDIGDRDSPLSPIIEFDIQTDFLLARSSPIRNTRKRTAIDYAWSPERRQSVVSSPDSKRHSTVVDERRKSIANVAGFKSLPIPLPVAADGRRQSIVMTSSGRGSIINPAERRQSVVNPDMRRQSIMVSLGVSDKAQLFKRQDTDKIDPIKFHPFSCSETDQEKNLRLYFLEHNQWILKIRILTIIFCGLFLGVMKIILITLVEAKTYNIISTIYFLSSIIWYILLWKTFTKIKKSKYIPWVMQCGYLIPFILFLIIEINHNSEIKIVEEAYLLFCTLLSSQCISSFFKHTISTTIVSAFLIVLDLAILNDKDEKYIYLISIISFELFMISISYFLEKALRFNYALEDLAKKELEKTENLLKQMMPPHVYRNLKEDTTITDSLTQVTLLYADIVGFTEWSSYRTPDRVVGMLYELFSKFDMKCVEHKVYKVHTIGDCYVAMGYSGDIERNPGEECLQIIKLAESMVEIIHRVNELNMSKLSMRIGIHTGSIVGGIAGTNIVRYDIYGKDVLIANKIESNGIAGRILLSEAAKNLIEGYKPDLYSFEFHKEIPIQAIKTSIKSFLLEL